MIGPRRGMATRNRVVLLTVSMVVLAGLLSAAAAFLHTRSVISDYDKMVKRVLREKGLAYGGTATAFMEALGPDGFGTLAGLIDEAAEQGPPVATGDGREQEAEFFNELLGVEAWLVDPSAPTGYRLVSHQVWDDEHGHEHVAGEELVLGLVRRTQLEQAAQAELDEEGQLLVVSLPLSISADERVLVVGWFSVSDEFAFFAAARDKAIRNTIVLAVATVAAVAVVGAGLSLYVSRDLTNRSRAEAVLRAKEHHVRSILDTAYDAFFSMDADGYITDWNSQAEATFGWSRAEALGRTFADTVIAPGYRERYRRTLQHLLPEDSTILNRRAEALACDRTGREFPVELVIWTTRTAQGVTFNAFVHDISERKRFEEQLSHAANYDPLTNLANRRSFTAELAQRLTQARRYAMTGAVLFMDLDQFKDVNDTLGHGAGDELLIQLAGLLQGRLRESDVIARFGGDEFAVLLPNTELHQASSVAEKLLQSLSTHTFVVQGNPIVISASIGVTGYPEHGTTDVEILARADLAMYHAKEDGRNRIHVYTPADEQGGETESRLTWRTRIHEALEQDRFLLFAQPILNVQQNAVSQHELLLRMLGEDGEVLLPGSFLAIAERSGSIQAIERWVVRRAIQLIAELRDRGREPCLEVNLSGKAFADKELLPLIQNELAASGITPSNLILEVTETVAIANITEAQEFVAELKKLGCRFALDDFGIGFSSFYLLKHLAVDYLKIDGSFIRDLPRSPVDQQLVRAIVGVARGLGIETIAEYVGDDETLSLLREFGIDYAQGYRIGVPAEVSQALRSVSARSARAA